MSYLDSIKDRVSLRTRLYWWSRWANGPHVSAAPAIIIGGCVRSGTTLMRAMLDSHPNIAIGPESWLFVYRVDYRVLAEEYAMSDDDVYMLCTRSTCLSHFIDQFFETYAERMGKPRWGEKSPTNVLRLKYIWRHFPKAKFIHMIRDGRDVVCSIESQHTRLRTDGFRIADRSLKQRIAVWREHVAAGMRWRGDQRYVEVKYENLAQAPRKTMEKVLDFLGEPWSEDVLRAHEIQRNHPHIANEQGTPEVRMPIFGTSVGRWRTELSERDAQRFWHSAGELLQSLGYTLECNDAAPPDR